MLNLLHDDERGEGDPVKVVENIDSKEDSNAEPAIRSFRYSIGVMSAFHE